jgi:hypothetical protein
MNDDELRMLIRAAIQKHVGGAESTSAHALPSELRRDAAFGGASGRGAETVVSISFGQYQLERAKDDTMCLIEPAVQCNHCGYCKCHGH